MSLPRAGRAGGVERLLMYTNAPGVDITATGVVLLALGAGLSSQQQGERSHQQNEGVIVLIVLGGVIVLITLGIKQYWYSYTQGGGVSGLAIKAK